MIIDSVYQRVGGNQVQAAKVPGISRNTLRHRLDKWSIAVRSAVRPVVPGGSGQE